MMVERRAKAVQEGDAAEPRAGGCRSVWHVRSAGKPRGPSRKQE